MALSGATTLGQSGPGSNGDKGVLCIFQSSSITGTSPSLFSVISRILVGGGSYPSAEKQSVYSTAPAEWGASTNEVNKANENLTCEANCIVFLSLTKQSL